MAIDSVDADVSGFEPVWSGERRIGFVTSGAYGHHVRQSLALAYVDRAQPMPAMPSTYMSSENAGRRESSSRLPTIHRDCACGDRL